MTGRSARDDRGEAADRSKPAWRRSSVGARCTCRRALAYDGWAHRGAMVDSNRIPFSEASMRLWDRFLTDRDREVFAGSGWGKRAGFGERPVLLVVDVNYAFAGDRPEPVEESIKRWPNSCGATAWEAAGHIRTVLDAAYERGIPAIYSTSMDPRPHGWGAGRWADKHARLRQVPDSHRALNNQIIEPIAPRPQDVVIQKEKPSAFFGSPLAAYLVDL